MHHSHVTAQYLSLTPPPPCGDHRLVVLESLGQQHWVDFGSLLGLVRGGDLILHDNDVDVVVLNPNWPELQAGLEKQLKGKYRVREPAAVCPVVARGWRNAFHWMNEYLGNPLASSLEKLVQLRRAAQGGAGKDE